MSGIMGIYNLDGRPVECQDLRRMLDALAHRGKDGAEIWCHESVGFGHRMLWTTPESLLEKLPLVNQRGDLAIVSDARIDNRDELIDLLQIHNSPAEKITDSQIILSTYEKWGEQCPEHLLGDFAFAIWDGRNQQLFCARDHMGVKPFYYHYQGGRIFTFGSEIKAIICLKEVPRRLNEIKVGDYLTSQLQDKSNTFYQDIFRLPPASCITLSAKGMQIRNYWALDPYYELQLSSDEEYAVRLREIFAEAVQCRLRSAFPIGSHLSGGLDSSSITCMARQLLEQESNNRLLHSFSNIFNVTPECDERPFIQAVIDGGGIIPHYVDANTLGPLSNLDRLFKYFDEAITAPNHFHAWTLNEAAQQSGVRVLLDGLDGDNTLSHGFGYLAQLVREGDWAAFAQEISDLYKLTGASPSQNLQYYGLKYLEELACDRKWITFVRECNQLRKYFNVSKRRLFLRHGLKPLLPQVVQQAWQVLRGYNQSTNNNIEILNRSFVRKIGLKKRIQALDNTSSKQMLTEREYHWEGLTTGLLTSALEISDCYAAAFSLESRHPFMDKRLIEFCLSLPPEQKLRKGWSRFVMRRAMSDILPEKVQWRIGKADLSSSFVYGLLQHNRKLLNEVMENSLEQIDPFVDTKYLRTIYEDLTSTKEIKLPESLIDVSLWQVSMFALWLCKAQLNQSN
jgi:asparagine synthase (glutamine-hydrolysing)